MKIRQAVMVGPLAAALFCVGGWAQQAPAVGTQNAPDESTKSAAKEKHLSGSLVDVGCLVKTLQSQKAQSPQNEVAPGVPHFAGAAEPSPQIGGAQGGPQAPSGAQTQPQGQQPGTMNPTTPDSGAAERARAEQEQRIDEATKACTPTDSAQTLGLAMSGGQVVQFDPSGTAKAKEALKDADVQPGKRIKAKVTGVMQDKNTLTVAAIDIKTKGKRSSAKPGR